VAFWDKWFSGKESAASPTPAPASQNFVAPAPGPASGMSALQLAVMTGDRETVKLLLDVGGNVQVFNQAAADDFIAATGAAGPAISIPGTEPPETDDDIKVRKPLTFKRKS
jgi:hypothetical protein